MPSGSSAGFGVPKTLDSPRETGLGAALAIDLGLLALFAVQHSVMARPAFKRWWTRLVPESAERSTYVLFSSLALILLFAYWEPLGGMVWNMTSTAGVITMYSLYAAGFALLLYVTFLIDHFDLFGLRQVWLQLRGRPYTTVPFVTPWLYRQVRHPLYIGWFMIVWATPVMTVVPPGVRGHVHRVHPRGHPVRGAGPDPLPSRIRRLQASGSDAVAVRA